MNTADLITFIVAVGTPVCALLYFIYRMIKKGVTEKVTMNIKLDTILKSFEGFKEVQDNQSTELEELVASEALRNEKFNNMKVSLNESLKDFKELIEQKFDSFKEVCKIKHNEV